MMCVVKKGISLLLAVLLLGMCVSALVVTQMPVRAVDSGDIDTASELKREVNRLSSSSTPAQVKAVAAQVQSLSDSEKRKVTSTVVKDLAKLYNTAFHLTPTSGKDAVDVDHGDERSSRRIDEDDSYAYGVSASWADERSHKLQIEQDKSSGGVLLKMELTGFKGPVYVNLEMEEKPFSSSKDYYVKWDGHKIDASVSSNSVRFVAPDTGSYRLYRDDGDDDDDDDDDDRYYSSSSSSSGMDSFWKSAANNIKSASAGDRVRVSLGTRTTVPTDVLQTLKGKDVTLALYEPDGNIISVYGKNVTVPSGSSVSVSALRSTYGKTSGTASSSSSSSGAGGLGVSPLPNGLGGTVAGGTSTPSAGGAPAPSFSGGMSLSPMPRLPTANGSSSSSKASSEKAVSSPEPKPEDGASSDAPVLPVFSEPEAEPVTVREPVEVPSADVGASRIQQVIDRVGVAGILVFMGMVGLTAALGGGLLTYAIFTRRDE